MPSGEAESFKGRLLIFQLEPIQTSGSGMVRSSLTSSSIAAPGSPFHDGMYCTPEHVANNNLGSSPDEASREGVRFEEGGGWELTLKWPVAWEDCRDGILFYSSIAEVSRILLQKVYRLHQLNRASQLVVALMLAIRGSEATTQMSAINASLQTLLNILQVLGVFCVWSLASFLMSLFPSHPEPLPP